MIRLAVRQTFRFALVWAVDAVSIAFTAWLLTDVNLVPTNGSSWVTAAGAAFMLGIVNLLIRPIILLLALPLGFFVIFGVGFIVNALTILIAAALLPGFQVQGFFAAFLAGLIMAVINTVVVSLLSIDDDGAFFQGLVERLVRRHRPHVAPDQGHGLVMLEIDGLSYDHMREAIATGRMPHVKRLMEEEGYVLSRVDCGLPSQTSSCQAGILFGNNYDIPAFRWYDKKQGRAFSSSKDAHFINARCARGNGLLREGSSINNMLNGDAAKSLLTLADLRAGTPEEKKARARDMYLLMINPYFAMRTLVLVAADALVEVWEYLWDTLRGVQPRLNRLRRGYPLVRAACTVFMRDVAEYLVTLDIVRGAPVIYATWPGYDEVAHHTGPSTPAALKTLTTYDNTIGRVVDVIAHRAPRPYEFILLSDHGQSFGATFKQRYGFSLMEFIERHLPAGSGVAHASGGDDGTIALAAVGGELENLVGQKMGGKVAASVARRGQQALERGVAYHQDGTATDEHPVTAQPESGAGPTAEPAAVTVFGSGNLAPVYFHFSNNRVTRPELEARYPGLFSALVGHEGIGVVMAYEADGTPVAWSKTGSRNLHTGTVEGADPLTMYGDPAVRMKQLSRLADFPSNGDLTIFSTVYPDGTVAAMEEKIGSHGGMGGVQTDAFLLHPRALETAAMTNSVDVFKVLDAWRRAPVPLAGLTAKPAAPDDFAAANLVAGIKQGRKWLPLAGRALLLDADAYAEVARLRLMTGPALLIALLASVFVGLVERERYFLVPIATALLSWMLATGAVYVVGRLLRTRTQPGDGKPPADYGRVVRTLGFAQSVQIVAALGLVPVLGDFARFLSTVLQVVAMWIAAVVAHDLRGWRAIVFPLAMLLVISVSLVVSQVLFQGAVLSVNALLQDFGLVK